MMLALPNACDGHQQTAQMMADDILTEPLPIATGPDWGRIERPASASRSTRPSSPATTRPILDHGEFPPYGERFGT